jgi:hypothetical protein
MSTARARLDLLRSDCELPPQLHPHAQKKINLSCEQLAVIHVVNAIAINFSVQKQAHYPATHGTHFAAICLDK